MNLVFFEKQFEEIVGGMSDEALARAFAEMGCEVEIVSQAAAWLDFPVASEFGCSISHIATTRQVLQTGRQAFSGAADSNELALAA